MGGGGGGEKTANEGDKIIRRQKYANVQVEAPPPPPPPHPTPISGGRGSSRHFAPRHRLAVTTAACPDPFSLIFRPPNCIFSCKAACHTRLLNVIHMFSTGGRLNGLTRSQSGRRAVEASFACLDDFHLTVTQLPSTPPITPQAPHPHPPEKKERKNAGYRLLTSLSITRSLGL